jgi:hypothetical protein
MVEGWIDSAIRGADGKILIKTSPKGDDFCSVMDFLQEFLTRYVRVVGVIIAPFVTLVVGLKWKDSLLPLITQLVKRVHF